jgi:tRNA(Leu) C34 or U34 (ribose-2'-O)-methylase TrmL
MITGFSCIGLYRPKTGENVGAVLRAAHCYGVSSVSIEGGRGKFLSHSTNTPAAHRHMPTYLVDDLLASVPYDTQIVVVDLIEGATPLPNFTHPKRALYLFGPEDGTLGRKHTDRAQHVVYVPTRCCMNLAATVNVVLYDRQMKRAIGPGMSMVAA